MTRVMIIEDDPMVMEINKRFLSKVNGFQLVGISESLENVKQEIVRLYPDLVLLDVFFPTGRGTDILKWIRAKEIQTDVILITADKNSETVAEAFRYGVVDYLIKPFKFERFEEALKNYRAIREKLDEPKQMNQELIDRLTNSDDYNPTQEFPQEVSNMENNQTFSRVLEYIKVHSNDEFTASSIAKILGISRITARRYLDHLEKHKVLILDLEYGSVGRPKNIFKLNPDYLGGNHES